MCLMGIGWGFRYALNWFATTPALAAGVCEPSWLLLPRWVRCGFGGCALAGCGLDEYGYLRPLEARWVTSAPLSPPAAAAGGTVQRTRGVWVGFMPCQKRDAGQGDMLAGSVTCSQPHTQPARRRETCTSVDVPSIPSTDEMQDGLKKDGALAAARPFPMRISGPYRDCRGAAAAGQRPRARHVRSRRRGRRPRTPHAAGVRHGGFGGRHPFSAWLVGS